MVTMTRSLKSGSRCHKLIFYPLIFLTAFLKASILTAAPSIMARLFAINLLVRALEAPVRGRHNEE